MGIPTIVFIVLLTLKLCGLVTTSWFWVFFPLVVEALIALIIIGVLLAAALIVSMAGEK